MQKKTTAISVIIAQKIEREVNAFFVFVAFSALILWFISL